MRPVRSIRALGLPSIVLEADATCAMAALYNLGLGLFQQVHHTTVSSMSKLKTVLIRKKDYKLDDTLKPANTSGYLATGDPKADSSAQKDCVVSTILDTLIEESRKEMASLPRRGSSSSATLSWIPDSDSNDEESTSVPMDTSFYESSVPEKEIHSTMVLAFSTVLYVKEVTNVDMSKKLNDYVLLRVFRNSEEIIKEQWKKATSLEKPEKRIICKVKRGSGLIVKDANGKSDPYVRLGIIDATHQAKPIVKTKNLLDWVKEPGILPTKEIKETTVKKATLEPQWNEQVELVMGRVEKEVLVLEVWDSDKSEVGITKVRNVKGLGHFLSDLRRGDDFMGRAFFPLSGISGKLEDKLLDLSSHSSKHKYGMLNVDLSIKQIRSTVKLEVGIMEHLQLTHAVVNCEGRMGGQYQKRWSGELSDLAEKLLDKHAEFCGLSELHKTAVRLSVLVKYNRMFRVKVTTFIDLVKKIISLESEFPSSTPSASSSQTPAWVVTLFKELSEIANEVEETLKTHLTLFKLKERDLERIRHRVKFLLEVYSFPLFVKQLPLEKRNLRALLERSVEAAATNWFTWLRDKLFPEGITPQMQLSAFKGLMELVLHHCNKALNKINPIYEIADIDYFTHFFLTIDSLVSVEARSKLEVEESGDSVSTYEVYKIMKEVKKLTQFVDKKCLSELNVLECHLWFENKVDHWITMAAQRCRELIKKAIDSDEVVQMTGDVQFSSSAVDGAGFLILLVKLDDELEWPAKAEAFTLRVSIVRSVCDCALYYVDEVYESLKKEDMLDKQEKFKASAKLSIILNNMHHFKQVIVEYLKEQTAKQLEGGKLTEEEKSVQKHAHKVMESVTQSTGEDIDNKISQIITQISKLMSPEIKRLLAETVSSRTPTVSLEAIDPLMTYMAGNLQILGHHLLTPVLLEILRSIWNVFIDCLASFLGTAPTKKGSDPIQYYTKLAYILQSALDFFHAEGNGLSLESLNTDKFKDLGSNLKELILPTDKLILQFFSDLATLQTKVGAEGSKRGTIQLSVGYHASKGSIELNVIQAKNLSGLGAAGQSDSFVEVCLAPPWLFGHSQPKKQKTSVKKKTNNPFFNEDLMIPVSTDSLATEGAVLLVMVFHHETIRANELCGVCVVSCKDIPILSKSHSAFDNSNVTERKNLLLPLLKIDPNIRSLREITARANSSDVKAVEFLKSNKQILAVSDPPKTA